MEGTATAVCQILKYLIIHWKYETASVSKEGLLEGQLIISTEALNSKHQANTLHCVTTIASAGGICGGLSLKKFLKEMLYRLKPILPGFSAQLNWTSEKANHSQHTSGAACFQMIFEVDENPTTLVKGSLVIKNFLHKIIMVNPKIRFYFSVNVNGIFSKEIFGAENEPTLNLSNGIALVVNCQHYDKKAKEFKTCRKLGALLKSNSYLGRGLKDCTLRNLVLPDVSYQAESSERGQHLLTDPQEQALLLFLFVDFHSRLPAQHMELWGVHVWLTTHLSRILMESHSAVQDSLQLTVDRTLEQHCLATKGHQTLQTSLSVAVNSIMSIVTGSTSSGFRNICLKTLQAADTQEFRTKLNQAFHELTQHQFPHHSSCEVNQVLPDTSDTASSAQDTHGDSGLEPFGGAARPEEGAKRRRRGSPGPEESPAPGGAGGGPEDALWQREVANLAEWLRPET